ASPWPALIARSLPLDWRLTLMPATLSGLLLPSLVCLLPPFFSSPAALPSSPLPLPFCFPFCCCFCCFSFCLALSSTSCCFCCSERLRTVARLERLSAKL